MATKIPPIHRAAPQGDAARPIRLMIVDDSIIARTVISRMLEPFGAFEVVACATHAAEAIEMLDRFRVDIILLDVEMPGVDGLTALPEILARSQGAHVLIVSSAAEAGAAASVKALTLGAADTLLKPGAGKFAGRFAEVLAERLLRIGRATPRHSPPVEHKRAGPDSAPTTHGSPIECLAIGASTGGVNALTAFFHALPPSFSAPILVTQHLPALFMTYFAAQLREIAKRPSSVAAEGARLVPGEILIAPGEGHLRVVRTTDGVRVRLDRAPTTSGCLPSVDPMFTSVAEVFGPAALGVVLSGMGRDGLIGAGKLVAIGGEVLVQDAQSSVVWGMPGAVANAGLACAVLPPARIARRIAQRSGDVPWR